MNAKTKEAIPQKPRMKKVPSKTKKYLQVMMHIPYSNLYVHFAKVMRCWRFQNECSLTLVSPDKKTICSALELQPELSLRRDHMVLMHR